MWLWRLRSPMICHLQTRAQEIWRYNSVQVWSLEIQESQWAREEMKCSNSERQKKVNSSFLCVLFCRPSKDYMMLIHIGEGNLRNPPTQVLILSRDIFTDTPRSNCLIWAICGQSSWHRKFNRGTGALSEERQHRWRSWSRGISLELKETTSIRMYSIL